MTARLRALLWPAALSSAYALASFLWSAIGFLSPTAPIHFHEYALPALASEVGGHVLFGVLAAAPAMDAGLILLAAGESVLIDSDHLLASLGYQVAGRPAHSIFFALGAAALLAYLSARTGRPGRGVFLVTLSSVAAHLAFDAFAGNGFFYILFPLSFASYGFPYWVWPLLFAAALSVAALARATGPGRRWGPVPA